MGSANVMKRPGKNPYLLFGSYDNNLYCLDAVNGEVQWKHETENFVNGTPAVYDSMAAFGGCDQYLRVLDGATGNQKMRVNAGSYIAESVAVADGEAYLGHYGGEVVCISLGRGRIRWKYESEQKEPFFSSPAVTAEKVVIGCRDSNIYCIDRESGKESWIYRTRGQVDGSPVVAGRNVLAGSGDGRLYLLSLEDGTKKAEYDTGSAVQTTPAVQGNVAVVGTEGGSLLAVRFAE
jgi:outer membrane protein assembly factor BamB